VLRVAPVIVLQCAPFASQRYHWYAYEIPPLPDRAMGENLLSLLA